MKKLLLSLTIIVSICSCKKDTNGDDRAIKYQNIGLTVPLNVAFSQKFDIKPQYNTDIVFKFKKVGNVFTAEYETTGAFNCNGNGSFVDTKSVNDVLTPSPRAANTNAFKFLEATVNGSTITYANGSTVKFGEDAYIPYYIFLFSSQTLSSVGWLKIKCTQTELTIYETAHRIEGEIKVGEK